MDNANSPEYLNKIKNAIIENLSRTKFAPSTQMQDTPRDIPGLNDVDEQDAELDDLDEDENKDVRKSQRARDKEIERDDEFSESEDEGEGAGLGIVAQPGTRKRKNIMEFVNPNAVADDQPVNGTPGPPGEIANGEGNGEALSETNGVAVESTVVQGEREMDIDMQDESNGQPAVEPSEPAGTETSAIEQTEREDVEMLEAEKNAGQDERAEESEKAEARTEAAS